MATIVDADLIADIVQQLNVRGELAPFEISQIAFPVFDIGRLTGLTGIQKVATPDSETAVRVGTATNAAFLPTGLPTIDPTSLISAAQLNPTAGQNLIDTGQLAAGQFLLDAYLTTNIDGARFDIQWRNAADAANLGVISVLLNNSGFVRVGPHIVDIGLNERVRIINVNVLVGTVIVNMSNNLVVPSAA